MPGPDRNCLQMTDCNDVLIESTASFVRDTCYNDASGHDWFHIERVWKLALRIGKCENADLFIVQMAALLHDLDDWKLQTVVTDEPLRTANYLLSVSSDRKFIDSVLAIIEEVSFKGAGTVTVPRTVEGKVVQDADRLDALGAIGIARAFAYGGFKRRRMHDPDIPPQIHQSFEEYQTRQSTTLNHFYEKLLLLKDRMNTDTGRQLAENRHRYMLRYIEQFMNEWNGRL